MPNEDGALLQRWQIYSALAGFVLTCGGIVFWAGASNARLEDRQGQLEKHVDYDDAVFVRADVLSVKLESIQETQRRIEGIQEEQSKTLEQLLLRR
jgi:hypothetical protein